MRINLLIDLSGTLHIGDVACPGAIVALEKIRQAKAVSPYSVHLRFCSNTTKESTHDLQTRLKKAGFSEKLIPTSSISTSLDACKSLTVEHKWRPLLLLSPSAQSTFREDVQIVERSFFPQEQTLPSTLDEKDRQKLQQCDTVIIALAPDLFNAEWMDEAFRVLSSEYRKGEKNLVATHRALYYRPSTSAPLSLGPGAYAAALEAACHRKPDETSVCGKPSRAFFESCLQTMRSSIEIHSDEEDEERNIIIDDDIEADLGDGAIEMGLERILVQTGKYREGDEKQTSKPVKIFASFAEFVDKELFANSILK